MTAAVAVGILLARKMEVEELLEMMGWWWVIAAVVCEDGTEFPINEDREQED